jgi:hypothetical protein
MGTTLEAPWPTKDLDLVWIRMRNGPFRPRVHAHRSGFDQVSKSLFEYILCSNL